ncbi:hypothetical protein DMA11_21215 [Marinilabiliaceae bacterium JC017]|nr:hypothetical protein DMA11_21215 [Marinilabiliaceae bacterium JC017]
MNEPAIQSKKQYEKKDQKTPVDPTWSESFTEEQLKKAWIRYSQKCKNVNPRLYSIMDNHQPVIKADNELLLKLKNKTQETEMQQEKRELLSFLKTGLKNAQINLQLEVVPDEKDNHRAYTASDKMKAMMEKNPALLALKQKFALDLE